MAEEDRLPKTFEDVRGQVADLARESVRQTLGGKKYESARSKELIQQISSSILDRLKEYTNFKFIVNCLLMPDGGKGLDQGGSCLWEHSADGYFGDKIEVEDQICIINVYGVTF